MSVQEKVRRDSVLISATTIILAGIVLLSLRAMLPVSYDYSLRALQLSLALGVGVCFTLFARRFEVKPEAHRETFSGSTR